MYRNLAMRKKKERIGKLEKDARVKFVFYCDGRLEEGVFFFPPSFSLHFRCIVII